MQMKKMMKILNRIILLIVDFEERIPEPLPEFENVKKLEKEFNIIQTPGDGNYLFNSLSYIIFNSCGYHAYIRQKICDYLEVNNDYEDEADKNDEKKELLKRDKLVLMVLIKNSKHFVQFITLK